MCMCVCFHAHVCACLCICASVHVKLQVIYCYHQRLLNEPGYMSGTFAEPNASAFSYLF